ncbi:Cyclin-D4-2-like protein, partial [Drosera capensis]
MPAKQQAGISPDFITEGLHVNFQSMEKLGDPVYADNFFRLVAGNYGSVYPWCLTGLAIFSCSATAIEKLADLVCFLVLSFFQAIIEFVTIRDEISKEPAIIEFVTIRDEISMEPACFHFGYGASTFCVAVNYFDRYLSILDLPEDQSWHVQLVAVACFSIAAKVDEIYVPSLVAMQRNQTVNWHKTANCAAFGQEEPFSVEPAISPIILTLWASHVSDLFISVDAIEVLEPTEQPEGLVAGSLDLMTMLLKNAPKDVVKAVYDVCFDPVIRLVLQSDDHGELQYADLPVNATECLAAFVSGAGSDILTWAGDPGFVMRSLFDALSSDILTWGGGPGFVMRSLFDAILKQHTSQYSVICRIKREVTILNATMCETTVFGDASGIQSPVSFGGFGSLTRHHERLSTGTSTDNLISSLNIQSTNSGFSRL